nr:hypothetical protein [uncultured Dongia sp.]
MVGPEGHKSTALNNHLDCQTSQNRGTDPKELFQELSNPPPDSPKKNPGEPASVSRVDLDNQGEAEDTPEATGDQGWELWDWQKDRADVIVPTQLAIAAYRATRGMIAIRQERDEYEDQDHIVLVHPKHIPALIERLQRLVGGE